MKLLLDTHALLWALGNVRKLPNRARAAITNPENDVYVSAVSAWEISIKASLGKLRADVSEIARVAEETGFAELPVHVRHTLRLHDLPPHHRDPFDRMLVAQALEEDLTIVTQDDLLARYAAPILWG